MIKKLNNKGQMITPVIIPYRSEPCKCPKCKKEEDIKQVCKNCSYEYPEEEGGGFIGFLIITFILIITYLFVTMLFWLSDLDHRSLFEIVGSQIKWFSELRVW